jgi:LruC domain-containing protein
MDFRELSKRSLLGLGLAALTTLPTVALAQDADGDGVTDAADLFPCDADRASVSYFPGTNSMAMIVYEDQWPNTTDLDFNDVVFRVHYRMERNAAGNVKSLHAYIDPDALGGLFSNGLGLQLASPRDNATVRRRVGAGGWESVALESDANATMVLSPNLRELFGFAEGRINSVVGQTLIPGVRLEFEVEFATPVPLPASLAPFDLFVFRTDTSPRLEIHFPHYSGTASMDTSLFGTAEDGSTATRRFVHVSQIPAALSIYTGSYYPNEGVQISTLFPNVLTFANSGGVSATDFYSSSVVASAGRQVASRVVSNVAARDTSCIQTVAVCGDGNLSGDEVCDSTQVEPCTANASDISGMPSYCGTLVLSGTRRCNSSCSGWGACEAPQATVTSNSYGSCSNASINITDYFCCSLDTCRNDSCCGGANGSNSVLGSGYTQQALLANSQGRGNCRLGINGSLWQIAVTHTTAAYRCWR